MTEVSDVSAALKGLRAIVSPTGVLAGIQKIVSDTRLSLKYAEGQSRDDHGRWASDGGASLPSVLKGTGGNASGTYDVHINPTPSTLDAVLAGDPRGEAKVLIAGNDIAVGAGAATTHSDIVTTLQIASHPAVALPQQIAQAKSKAWYIKSAPRRVEDWKGAAIPHSAMPATLRHAIGAKG